MTEHLPKWPDSLPPPIEFVEGAPQHCLTEADFDQDNAIDDLIHDMYWFPDDVYLLYFVYGEGVTKELTNKLELAGIAMRKTELFFFKHPQPAYSNEFIRILANDNLPQWMADAAKGPMHGQVTLSLEPAKRKMIDFYENAKVASQVLSEQEPIFEFKPNFAGLGVNLNSFWLRIKKWWYSR